MNKEKLNRFVKKKVVIAFWDRETKKKETYVGTLESIENEFIVVDYGKGLARLFIADLRNIILLENDE